MSATSLHLALDRIRNATQDSPIAVFKLNGNTVNTVFAATVYTRHLIENNDPDLIGVYDNMDNLALVRLSIGGAMRHPA